MINFLKNLFSRSNRRLPRHSEAKAGKEPLTEKPKGVPSLSPGLPRECGATLGSVPQNPAADPEAARSANQNSGPFEGNNPRLIAQNSTFSFEQEHTSTGKIARLPVDIREQINQRLYNGQPGPEILPWLNELPAVKEILAAQFGGTPITKQNLSHWRQLGFQRWLRQKQNINSAEELGKHAREFTEAAGGRFAPAVAAVSAAKIFEYLDKVNVEDADPNDLAKLGMVSFALLKGEQNFKRIEVAQERIRQGDDKLLLTRHKHERDVTATALRVLGDARAKEIEAAPVDNHEKIEMLGRHMHERTWRHRPIPAHENPFNFPPNQ